MIWLYKRLCLQNTYSCSMGLNPALLFQHSPLSISFISNEHKICEDYAYNNNNNNYNYY